MRSSIFIMAATLVLAGCGDNAQADLEAPQSSKSAPQTAVSATEIKIADIDLFNMAETHDIAKKLAPADAALFLEYAINWKAAQVSGDQSKILRSDGTTPVTIADAIAVTKAMLSQNANSQ